MTKAEKERLEESITKAEALLAKGLFLPEDASALRRIIAYDRKRIAKEYQPEAEGGEKDEV
jgi:hypothetical protein